MRLDNQRAYRLAQESTEKINDICHPLLTHFDISLFRYTKSFKNNTKLTLCNRKEFNQAYFEEEFYEVELADIRKFPKSTFGFNVHKLCAGAHPACKFWYKLGQKLEFSHVLCFYFVHDDHLELFNFAINISEHDHGSIAIFLNSIDAFKAFTQYFKNQAQAIIEKASVTRININKPIDKSVKNWLTSSDSKVSKFLEDITYEKVYLTGAFDGEYLTRKEAVCLKETLEGKKYNDTASALNCSVRTIEAIMKQVKTKLRVNLRLELFDVCKENKIYELLCLNLMGTA